MANADKTKLSIMKWDYLYQLHLFFIQLKNKYAIVNADTT
jgi:hypothetical protein